MNTRSRAPRLRVAAALAASLWLVATAATGADAPPRPKNLTVILATTTSLQDTGLIDTLGPLFERRTGYKLKVLSVGTGAALALGERGEADVVLAHAPEAEKAWMAKGCGTKRMLVMHNHFLVVGPPNDPARIASSGTAKKALAAIAAAGSTWISRDDGSGTDLVEKTLFAEIGLKPGGKPWYVRSGQGMGATLTMADQKRAYTLCDRSTYLSRKKNLQLVALVEGDPRLVNLYHVLPVHPKRLPAGRGNEAGGAALAEFLVGPEAQGAIGAYGREKFGEPLFVPDAGRTEAQVRGR